MTEEELVRLLDVDEPDYEALARNGPSLIPILERLVQTGSIAVATKALSLAGQIGAPETLAVIERAREHADPRVRTAAAGTLGRFRRLPSATVLMFLNDVDPGVRARALKTLRKALPQEIKAKVKDMIEADPDPGVRSGARTLANRK